MKPHLLLVDDDRDSLDSMKALATRQFRVEMAGPETPIPDAQIVWRENRYIRLAIVDLQMPGPSSGLDPEQPGLLRTARLKTSHGTEVA